MVVWTIKSPTEITLRMTITLEGYENYVLAVDFTETNIISGSKDKTIKVRSRMLQHLINVWWMIHIQQPQIQLAKDISVHNRGQCCILIPQCLSLYRAGIKSYKDCLTAN